LLQCSGPVLWKLLAIVKECQLDKLTFSSYDKPQNIWYSKTDFNGGSLMVVSFNWAEKLFDIYNLLAIYGQVVEVI